MLDRATIVARLREIASLLNMHRASRFKARAFERGARALEASKLPIEELVDARRLKELPGIGGALALQIEELYRTERSELLESLRAGLPSGVVELAQVPGIGLHRLRELHAQGISGIDDLRRVATEKQDEKLLAAIQRYEAKGTRLPLGRGLMLARDLEQAIGAIDGVHAVRVRGDVARGVEIANELELEVAAPDAVRGAVLALPAFASARDDQARMPDGTMVRFLFVDPAAAEPVRFDPDLVREGDVRGLIHCHTTWSDGKNTIEEMARAAEESGAEYITITDHSRSAHYAKGLSIDDLRRQWDEIAAVQERVRIKILRGTEADILADGALDWPEDVLEQLDVVIASIHNRHRLDAAKMTERVTRAVRHPLFKIWGHPLGRLIGSRPPIDVDVPAVLDAIAESRCAIEINGDPTRLDLPPEWIREARTRGLSFVLSTDAHSINGLRAVQYATAIARAAGVRRSEVLNVGSASDFVRDCKPRA